MRGIQKSENIHLLAKDNTGRKRCSSRLGCRRRTGRLLNPLEFGFRCQRVVFPLFSFEGGNNDDDDDEDTLLVIRFLELPRDADINFREKRTQSVLRSCSTKKNRVVVEKMTNLLNVAVMTFR